MWYGHGPACVGVLPTRVCNFIVEMLEGRKRNVFCIAGDKPLHAAPEVPLLEHIQEMRTPAPEQVLAEFRAQKGIAEPAAQPAIPEQTADEPAAEAEEAVITPRSGASHTLAAVSLHCMVWQCSHVVQA